MATILVVTSGEGGAGKTTSTAPLGAALARPRQAIDATREQVGAISGRNIHRNLRSWVGQTVNDALELPRWRRRHDIRRNAGERRKAVSPAPHATLANLTSEGPPPPGNDGGGPRRPSGWMEWGASPEDNPNSLCHHHLPWSIYLRLYAA